MKGNNTLEVNEAMMIEAMQMLLDRDAPGAGKVTSVKIANNAPTYGSLFTVAIEAKTEPP